MKRCEGEMLSCREVAEAAVEVRAKGICSIAQRGKMIWRGRMLRRMEYQALVKVVQRALGIRCVPVRESWRARTKALMSRWQLFEWQLYCVLVPYLFL